MGALGFSSQALVWNIKIKVGMFAQIVNLSMTMIYFFTPYPSRMKNQMQVEALQSQQEKKMQEEFIRCEALEEQLNARLGMRFSVHNEKQLDEDELKLKEEVESCRCKLIRDITLMAHAH